MFRIIPLVFVLLFVGLIIYLVAQVRYSPDRAKHFIIKVLFWIFSILTLLFLLGFFYAFLDQNPAVMELLLMFAAVPGLGLLITIICGAIFKKNHPNFKAELKNSKKNESFKEFWINRLKKALKEYLNRKFRR